MAGFPTSGIGTHFGDTSIVEDVTDIIYQITPEDTPFFTMSGDTVARAVTHEWQKRSLSTRNDNAFGEGFTYTFPTAMNTPNRVTNITQIFNKEIRVSNTEQSVGHYAISDSFADQMQLRLTEMKTDKEHTYIQGTLASGSATNVARRMIGMIQAITSNQTTFTSFGGAQTMNEDRFNDRIQVSWDEGGEPRDVLVGGFQKRNISTFVSNNTKFIEATQQRQVNTISMYDSDFFPVQIHLSRDIPSPTTNAGLSGDGMLFIDKSMARKAWLRRVIAKRVPETADSLDGVTVCETSLEWGNEAAHNYVDNIKR